jgi:hypothetical protein
MFQFIFRLSNTLLLSHVMMLVGSQEKKEINAAHSGPKKRKNRLLAEKNQLEALKKQPLLILEVDSFRRPTATPPFPWFLT